MGRTNLILGPPGTGKTTTLLNLVDDALSRDVKPEKIGFISFTKKSVDEARDRAAKRFEKDPSWFSYFRTIHSLSFRQLAMSRTQVMGRQQYQELGRTMGIEISGIHRQDQAVYEMKKGDQMVFLESLARLKCEKLEVTWNDANSDLDIYELRQFRATLEKFKKANLLYDFTDMLTRYSTEGYKPELDVLFVDEAQDLCQLQWDIVNALIEKATQTYIAGDDDQAIFRWSGAAVDYFLGLSKKYDTKVLDQSYRLPKKVHAFSERLVETIENRNEKRFLPKDEEGEVNHIDGLDDIDMDKGSWLILVRNGYLIRDVVGALRSRGLMFETTYYSVANDDALKAAFYWERMRADKILTAPQVKLMVSFVSTKHLGGRGNRNLTDPDETISQEAFMAMFKVDKKFMSTVWFDALDRIPSRDIEYYRAIRRQGESLTDKPRIKVSTIHGAKGGEAENVVVFRDMSAKTYWNMEDNPDDESRVFYVAFTRSSQRLYIVEPQTQNYFNF